MVVLSPSEYLQALRLMESLDRGPSASPPDQDSSVVQVVIGSGKLRPQLGGSEDGSG